MLNKVIIFVLVILVFGGYLYKVHHVDTKVVPGEGAVKEVEYYKHWINVKLKPDANSIDLVDLKLFHGFDPKITTNEARIRFGEPSNVQKKEFYEAYEYSFPNARIELTLEQVSDGTYSYTDKGLYSYPYEVEYSEFFNDNINKYIIPNVDETVVTLIDDKDEPKFLASIKGTRIDHIIWYK